MSYAVLADLSRPLWQDGGRHGRTTSLLKPRRGRARHRGPLAKRRLAICRGGAGLQEAAQKAGAIPL